MFKMDLFGEMPASHGNPEMLIFFTLCVTERSKGHMENKETNLTSEKLVESQNQHLNRTFSVKNEISRLLFTEFRPYQGKE